MAKTRVSKAPEERRAELIAAARYLFDKDGVDATRVSDIVERVGVAKGVFYYYFRSKDQIVKVVAEEVIAELKTNIQEVMDNQEWDFFKKMSELIELYFDLIDQFTGDNELVLPDFDSGSAGSATPLQKARDVLMEQLLKLVAEGISQGLVKAQYADWTVYTIEAGLRRIALQKLPARRIVYTLVEQSLCLPQGELIQHCKPSAAKKKN